MHLIKRQWSRRDFLRAAGITSGAALVAPLIPSESRAAASGLKRLILVQTGNGTILPNWRSNGGGTPFKDGGALPALQGPILAPLDAFRDRLLLLDGIDLATIYPSQTSNKYAGNHGHAGSSVLWTGVNGGGQTFSKDGGTYSDSPSLDQVVNDRIGGGRKSLQVGIWNRPIDPRQVYSYDANATPLPVEPNPQVVFDTVFKDGFPSNDTNAPPDRIGPRRKRTLELLRGELTRLKSTYSAGDRERFERHIEGIDALESRIAALAGGPQCSTSPADRPSIGKDFRVDFDATIDAQIGNIVHAMSCDLSRVASFSLLPENVWATSASLKQAVPNWKTGEVHNVSHTTNQGLTDAERKTAISDITALQRYAAVKFGELLTALTDAGLMDETLVVWSMAMSHGGMHSNRNVPVVIAQGNAGPLAAGRYLRWGKYEQDPEGNDMKTDASGNETNNNLLISLAHAMGLDDIKVFGTADRCRATGLDDRLMK